MEGRDKWYHEEIAKVPNYCPPEIIASEDPLFLLCVSFFFRFIPSPPKVSAVRRKGFVHTTGGYLVFAALTVKDVFDVHQDDKFGCADSGWSSGHVRYIFFKVKPESQFS
jgi:acetyl-CoA synthetase